MKVILSVVIASIMLLAVGCSATVPHLPQGQASANLLCSHLSAPTDLLVKRENTIPQNHIKFNFPTKITINNQNQVKNLITVLCHLPRMPQGIMSCPIDLGVNYQLIFFNSKTIFSRLTADIWGCQTIRGLNFTRWAATKENFWQQLAIAMKVHPPTENTLRGSLSHIT